MAGSTSARLLVVLSEENSMRMVLPGGIPESLEELINDVKRACTLSGRIRLQYKDTDFGEMFVNLASTAEIKDLSIVKVIQMDDHPIGSPISASGTSSSSSIQGRDSCCVGSSGIDSTIILDRSPLSLRTIQWPKEFPIPRFSLETEIQLQKGNSEYNTKKLRLAIGSKLLSDILGKLAEEIFKYKAYPKNEDYSEVAQALIKKHPCLSEPGSSSAFYGWKQRLKFKMANYRTQLKVHGTPEVVVNSLKVKAPHSAFPAKKVKRPRRAEVNYYPSLPCDTSPETMEKEREFLLTEVKKRGSRTIVAQKMEQTFAFRRQEVIDQETTVDEVRTRWPALFQITEVHFMQREI